MTCSRGAASPDDTTKLRLFADSGGFCQKPDCTRELFLDLKEDRIHIAEIAHIIASSDAGPRGNAAVPKESRGAYENLLLLCPSCHTEIDKAPATYPDDLVAKWKREHKERLHDLFGVKKCSSRTDLRATVEPLLSANKCVFDQYGPELDYSLNPEAAEAHTWKHKVITVVLPNSRRLLALLDANRDILNVTEREALERFRQHVDDVTARHIGASPRGGALRFPREMATIAEDEASYEQ